MSNWISVGERLPEKDDTVVAWRWTTREYKLANCIFQSDKNRRWCYDGIEFFYGKDGISHWMPLPEPPEVEK